MSEQFQPPTKIKPKKEIAILRNSKNEAYFEIFHKEKRYECIVDDYNYHDLSKYTMHISGGYVQIRVNGELMRLHRYLLKATKGDPCIDHINNNPFDNRMAYIRKSNDSLNSHNKTKKNGTTSKYQGSVTKDKKYHSAGCYDNEIDAANAYDELAFELYKEYANLNFPEKFQDRIKLLQNSELSQNPIDDVSNIKKNDRTNKYRGVVSMSNIYNNYRSSIRKDGVLYKEYFDNEEDAARFYDRNAFELKQEKAKLNFPEEYKDRIDEIIKLKNIL